MNVKHQLCETWSGKLVSSCVRIFGILWTFCMLELLEFWSFQSLNNSFLWCMFVWEKCYQWYFADAEQYRYWKFYN